MFKLFNESNKLSFICYQKIGVWRCVHRLKVCGRCVCACVRVCVCVEGACVEHVWWCWTSCPPWKLAHMYWAPWSVFSTITNDFHRRAYTTVAPDAALLGHSSPSLHSCSSSKHSQDHGGLQVACRWSHVHIFFMFIFMLSKYISIVLFVFI